MNPKDIQTINNSNMARIASEYFGGMIDKGKKDLLSKMKNAHIAGKHDVVSYASSLAAIIALEELENQIKRQIDAANHIEGKLLNHANSK